MTPPRPSGSRRNQQGHAHRGRRGSAVNRKAVASQPITIGREDIYQAVAYGQHYFFHPCGVGLVYPVALVEGETIPQPYRVTGFSRDVDVFFFDVGPNASSNLNAFRQQLLECAGGVVSPLPLAA